MSVNDDSEHPLPAREVTSPEAKPLAHADRERGASLTAEFESQPGTCVIDVDVPEASATYTSSVTVSIRMATLTVATSTSPREVAYCATLRPGDKIGNGVWTAPLSQIEVVQPSDSLVITQERLGDETSVSLQPDLLQAELNKHVTGFEVKIKLDSAFALYSESADAPNWMLGLKLTVPDATRVLLRIHHPDYLQLRCRLDNSEYHTLAHSNSKGRVTKVTFIRGSTAELVYLYGQTMDSGAIRAIAKYPLSVGGALFMAGLATYCNASGKAYINAAFGAALAPLAFQLFSRDRPFYGSSDIPTTEMRTRVYVGCMFGYAAGGLAALLAITNLPELTLVAQGICYSLALALLFLGLCILILVREGTFPANYCDNCASRFYRRKRAHIHTGSRRTLCKTCFPSYPE